MLAQLQRSLTAPSCARTLTRGGSKVSVVSESEVIIAPSILSADFGRLGEEIALRTQILRLGLVAYQALF